MKISLAFVCACLLVGLAAGCGGGGEETIAKAEFDKRANAICATAHRDRSKAFTDALEARGNGESNQPLGEAATEKLYVEEILPVLAQMTDELEELGEPETGAEDVATMIASLHEGIETMEADSSKVLGGEVDLFATAESKAKALGLEECESV